MKKHKVKGIEVDYSEPDFPYGMDITDEMAKILSEEISKQIDMEIISSLGIEEKKYRRKKSIEKIFNV